MSVGYDIKTLRKRDERVAIANMAAAHVIDVARRALSESLRMLPDEREEYAKRFEALIEELSKGVVAMRRRRPVEPPAFLQADSQDTKAPGADEAGVPAAVGTPVPIDDVGVVIRLLRASEALSHE